MTNSPLQPGVQPGVQPGDRVLYTPHQAHWLDLDAAGQYLFRFVYVSGRTRGQDHAGQEADLHTLRERGLLQRERTAAGHLLTTADHVIRHDGPRSAWPARVEKTATGGLQLDIPHPCGKHTLHYPLDAAPNVVVFDPTGKQPHSYRLS